MLSFMVKNFYIKQRIQSAADIAEETGKRPLYGLTTFHSMSFFNSLKVLFQTHVKC